MNEYGISKFAQAPSVTRSRATAMFCIAKLVAALRLTSRREALVGRCARGFGSAVGFGWALFLRAIRESPLRAENELFVLGHLWLFCGPSRTPVPTGW